MSEKEEITIPDEEWQEFLKDTYSNVMYPPRNKSQIETYLNWKKQKGERSEKTNVG